MYVYIIGFGNYYSNTVTFLSTYVRSHQKKRGWLIIMCSIVMGDNLCHTYFQLF